MLYPIQRLNFVQHKMFQLDCRHNCLILGNMSTNFCSRDKSITLLLKVIPKEPPFVLKLPKEQKVKIRIEVISVSIIF